MKYNLVYSPGSEPDVPPPSASAESSPGPEDRREGPPRFKSRPSPGDAVLITLMAGGKYQDIARDAGEKSLASGIEEEGHKLSPVRGGTDVVISSLEDKQDSATVMEEAVAQSNGVVDLATIAAMQTLAADALRQAAKGSPEPAQEAAPPPKSPRPKVEVDSEPREGQIPTAVPPIKTLFVDGAASASASHISPDRAHDMVASPAGELPPIRHSPQAILTSGAGPSQITLPSISAQLGNFEHLAEAAEPVYSTSPPGRPPQRFSAAPTHSSPPKSPNDVFRGLPSPGRNLFYPAYTNGHRRLSQGNDSLPQYQSPVDYHGSSSTEAPGSGTDGAGALPATMAIDRMSIDGITNPQIGGFQCTHPGCTAQPFQTQYLLNSHTNVHSQNRPHYCSVKGCPRSEGGKGFKRKNEMIRHGLVHDSPGYVCPFCPDREHKYPRPDNLQRHVRVHHVDKDKDDAQLRDVLSQRPEGPSRGRRRRGTAS
ncbi:uncharacterized protein L3040_007129 [Drepanopeziza brunnea f. sp. 'multigermtubi']|nr:hypothetical protein L3040_007129 [Drepanopeziza brunnea f. sp. 'multigermtubi']